MSFVDDLSESIIPIPLGVVLLLWCEASMNDATPHGAYNEANPSYPPQASHIEKALIELDDVYTAQREWCRIHHTHLVPAALIPCVHTNGKIDPLGWCHES